MSEHAAQPPVEDVTCSIFKMSAEGGNHWEINHIFQIHFVSFYTCFSKLKSEAS